MQVTDQVQAVWRCQQCAGQQRNGHLCRDDKYLIWFIKEVASLMRPNQTSLRSPPPCAWIYVGIFLETHKPHTAFHHTVKALTVRFFFYKYPQKTLICNEVAVPSQRGHRERQDKLWEAEGLVSLLPPLAIPPILLVGTVRAVKSWTAATEPMAACSGWGIACVRRWLDCIISIILLGFTLGIEALALIWN